MAIGVVIHGDPYQHLILLVFVGLLLLLLDLWDIGAGRVCHLSILMINKSMHTWQAAQRLV